MVLAAGLVSGVVKALCLFGACVVVGLIVVLLPTRLRTTVGSFAAAFVAAAGVLPLFLSSDETKTAPTPKEPQANAQYLAELIHRGPFTERLPAPLRAGELRDVGIGDPSAAGRLDAVQLDIDTRGEEGLYAFAEIEVYPSPSAAAKRRAARIDFFVEAYGRKNVYGGCVDDFWSPWGRLDMRRGTGAYVCRSSDQPE